MQICSCLRYERANLMGLCASHHILTEGLLLFPWFPTVCGARLCEIKKKMEMKPNMFMFFTSIIYDKVSDLRPSGISVGCCVPCHVPGPCNVPILPRDDPGTCSTLQILSWNEPINVTNPIAERPWYLFNVTNLVPERSGNLINVTNPTCERSWYCNATILPWSFDHVT